MVAIMDNKKGPQTQVSMYNPTNELPTRPSKNVMEWDRKDTNMDHMDNNKGTITMKPESEMEKNGNNGTNKMDDKKMEDQIGENVIKVMDKKKGKLVI